MAFYRSLRFQTSAIIIVSFLLSHIAGLLFYSLERRSALELTEAIDRSERAADTSRLLLDVTGDRRDRAVQLTDTRALRVWITTEPAVSVTEPTQAEADVTAYLRTQIPELSEEDIRVRFTHEDGYQVNPPAFDPSSRAGSPAWTINAADSQHGIAISIRHGADEWVNFLGSLRRLGSFPEGLFFANLLSAMIGIGLVAFWLVNRVTSPLSRFAAAAERLGRSLHSSPMDISGPKEVTVAAAAFNRMQQRLVRLIQGRTEFLAAISHDLRTPLSQIRLRLEIGPDTPDRGKNLRALEDVDQIIESFLVYARLSQGTEEVTLIDLGALVGSICDDLADTGAATECSCPFHLTISCRRLAIKRAVTNLIENALKYGHEARVSVERVNNDAVVIVEDQGPGIPEGQLEAVLRPSTASRSPAPWDPAASAWA